jgi:hypothetical protein
VNNYENRIVFRILQSYKKGIAKNKINKAFRIKLQAFTFQTTTLLSWSVTILKRYKMQQKKQKAV